LGPLSSIRDVAAVLVVAAAAFGAGTTVGADDERPQFLTDTSLRLTAARYAPAEVDLHWDGWIGAGVGVARWRETTLYLEGDVETVLGTQRRAFEANQSNYHLELGLRRAMSWGEGSFYIHHVSRHAVDRAKDIPVDWNVVMVSARREFEVLHRTTRLGATFGSMLHVSTVGYRREARATVEQDVYVRGAARTYLEAEVRAMKTQPTDLFPREGFIDARLEAGVRLVRERRSFEAFAAFERRNDVLLLEPAARKRVVIGLRLGLSAGTAPRDPNPPDSSPWCWRRWR
jgi:hypothetical protein